MYLIVESLALFYLLMALRLFTVWLAAFKRDTSVSPRQLPGAWLIIVVITILWPFVLPFAYLELLNAKAKVDDFCMTCNQILTAREKSANYN